MSLRYSVKIRNAALDARIAAIGPSPTLKIYSVAQRMGAGPKGELVSIQLPATWMSKADDGTVTSVGEWKGEAKAKGYAKSFCIFGKGGTCHIEGSIPREMTLDEANIAAGDTVSVEHFTVTSGNG